MKSISALEKFVLFMGILAFSLPLFPVVYSVWGGIGVLDYSFITESPKSFGREGGIFPTILSTVWISTIAVTVSVLMGLVTAIYVAEFTRREGWKLTLKILLGILSGIPSILYGMVGFIFFVIYLNMGWSMLSGSITLALMLTPTIARICIEALASIPREYFEETIMLGGSKWTYIGVAVMLIRRQILASLVLAIGRSVGETAALILTAGTALSFPSSPLNSSRPMSIHLLLLAKEGVSMENAFGTSFLLLILVCSINSIILFLFDRYSEIVPVAG